jgi:hypothetical protein
MDVCIIVSFENISLRPEVVYSLTSFLDDKVNKKSGLYSDTLSLERFGKLSSGGYKVWNQTGNNEMISR